MASKDTMYDAKMAAKAKAAKTPKPSVPTTTEDRVRQIIATPKTTAKPATPKSSVPTGPVNIPAPVDPNPNRAVLDPTQYPMAEIVTTTGEKVMVYTGGPLAGQDKNGNTPIQASGTTAKLTDGTDPDILSIMSGLGGDTPPSGGGGGGGNTPTFTATDGTAFTDKATYDRYQAMLNEKTSLSDVKQREGQSAYDILYKKFSELGLGSLVETLQDYIKEGLSEDEFTIRLRETPAYQKRFAANKQRIAKGLTALNESAYVKMEDKYQEVMRQYGLPESYWSKDSMGTQTGFEQLLANDVSNTELEDRIMTAQDRVLKANPEVSQALKQFYPGITNGDILAYTLDPKNAIKDIQRKVTAAEIGGAALAQGLNQSQTPEEIQRYAARAEQLAGAGVTKAAAQQGFETVAGVAPRGGQLAAIYNQDPYTQQTAEAEVFGLAGSAEAKKKREKLTALETASFSGQSGRGALARERAGSI
jgi:hypothetical protein